MRQIVINTTNIWVGKSNFAIGTIWKVTKNVFDWYRIPIKFFIIR